MKRVIIILLIAIIHFMLSVGLAMTTFEVSGFMFGIYPKPSNGSIHSVLTTIHTVLMFPLGLAAESLSPGMQFLGWPLVVLNSLLWAVASYMLIARLFPSRKRKVADKKRSV